MEGPVGLAGKWRPDRCTERLLWIGQLRLRFGERRRDCTHRVTGALHGCPPYSRHQSSPRRILNVSPGTSSARAWAGMRSQRFRRRTSIRKPVSCASRPSSPTPPVNGSPPNGRCARSPTSLRLSEWVQLSPTPVAMRFLRWLALPVRMISTRRISLPHRRMVRSRHAPNLNPSPNRTAAVAPASKCAQMEGHERLQRDVSFRLSNRQA